MLFTMLYPIPRCAWLLSLAGLLSAPAQAIVSTSSPTNWTPSSLGTVGLSSTALDGVAKLVVNTTSGAFGCSGSLLAGGAYVLTAAHCVTNNSGAIDTSSVSLSFASGTVLANVSTASQISVFSTWNGSTLGKNNDLALLRLDATVNAISGYSLYNSDAMGSTVLLAGYGNTGVGSTGGTAYTFGSLHWGQNQYEASTTGGSYSFDFDNGTSTRNLLANLGHSSSTGLGSLEANIASGDSGGSSFVVSAGQLYLAGVHSYISSYGSAYGDIDNLLNSSYGELGVDSMVTSGANRSWIESFVGVTTATPVPEPHTPVLLLAGLSVVGWSLRRRSRLAAQR